MTSGERMVWALEFLRDEPRSTVEAISAAADAVLRMRAVAADDTSLVLTDDERAMLDDMIGVAR